MSDVLEQLAELEHNKWVRWARHILSEEEISTQRVQRWARLFVPYNELSEQEKEKDRVLAKEVLRIVEDYNYENSIKDDVIKIPSMSLKEYKEKKGENS